MGSNKNGPTRAELQRFVDLAAESSTTDAVMAMGRKPGSANHWVKLAREAGIVARGDNPRALRQQIAALQRQISDAQREEDTAALIRERIYGLAAITPKPPAWITKPTKLAKSRGVPMTMWSDWHYGEVVRAEEVGGVNEFNAKIAAKRIQRLVDKTIELCFVHSGAASYPGIVVCLGGDLISGDIHDELAVTNDRTPYQAINDLADLVAAALGRMADAFGKVFVPCVVGNHGRGTHKPRHKGRVHTSFEWNLYCTLERHFRGDNRIHFMIPEETDCYFQVHGHRFLLTHGDSLGVRGGDGIIGSLGPIVRGALKVSKSEAQIGRDFDTIIMGHWHTEIMLNGLIVAGTLKGYDEYARLFLRAPYSRPSQPLWFCHERYGITNRWTVYLEEQRNARDGKQWLTILK